MNRKERSLKKRSLTFFAMVVLVPTFFALVCCGAFYLRSGGHSKASATATTSQAKKTKDEKKQSKKTPSKEQKATITASGDMLYHYVVYGSAFDGKKYDLANDFAQIKPLLDKADLSLGDFEGTINPNRALSGYPSFNAPPAVVDSIKDAGFDVIDLAHNHILDTGIEGLCSTAKTFHDQGLDTIGVNTPDQKDQGILVKEVNGIKIALLAYAYGFNGLENTISQADYDTYLKDLNMDKVAAEIQAAEEIADITVVMPQDGVEYALEPTEQQQANYRKMIDLGADIIFGGHPHVAEPTEIIEKDGQKKFILYSMGNLLSNQRYETLENYWTERGVIMEVEVTKKGDTTSISNIQPHPTWVSREPIEGATYTRDGIQNQAYDYQVFLAEDYCAGGQYAEKVPQEKQQRIETAYHEMMELLDLKW